MVIYMDMQTGSEIREAGSIREEVPVTDRLPQPELALQLQQYEFGRRTPKAVPPTDIAALLNAMARLDD